MAIKGCVFDFSGTLFRVESAESWLRGALAAAGITAAEADIRHYADRLDAVGALPGGSTPQTVPERIAKMWAERDVHAEHHREVYVTLAREADLPWPELYDVLYERHMLPQAWAPYPDAIEVLSALRDRGVPVALLSNIGWDARPVLRSHGAYPLLDALVLSFEEGVQKPDPRIFHIACERLGLAPQEVLMVGDSEEADGGARVIGCAFHHVEHLPVTERPDALRPVLDLLT
jgi:HAD superfamily hydrolase (TIGR01509 family)